VTAKRILVVERDAAGRGLMDRALASSQIAADAVASVSEAERALDEGAYALAIVDELAGTGAMLDEVRTVRRRWPKLPLLVTGTILSPRVLVDLMRIGVYEALPKPFLPDELRAAVERCLVRAWPSELLALDFEAAVAAAREALESLDLARTETMLRRAHGIAPLDADVVALDALRAELGERDVLADRWYRAALVLRDDPSAPPPDPFEGIARIAAYAGMPRVEGIEPGWTAWLIDDLRTLDREREPPRPWVLVTTIGLSSAADAAIHLRAGEGRAVAASLGEQRAETLASVLRTLHTGAIVANDEARARLELTRVEALLRGAP
jgi:DNA-binding response OmpR family regulator